MSAGMAIAPWGVLASGKIRTDEEEERRLQSGEKGRSSPVPERSMADKPTGRGEILARDDWKRTPEQRRVCKALEKVATEVGASNIAVGELLAKGVESRAF